MEPSESSSAPSEEPNSDPSFRRRTIIAGRGIPLGCGTGPLVLSALCLVGSTPAGRGVSARAASGRASRAAVCRLLTFAWPGPPMGEPELVLLVLRVSPVQRHAVLLLLAHRKDLTCHVGAAS